MAKDCTSLDMGAYQTTRAAVAERPELGRGAFEAVTEWDDGAQAVTRARSFTIRTDEPAPLGGKDEHIDPMELVLGALGSCLTIGWVTQANLRGVRFRDLRITVRAPYDLRGYLGLDDKVRPGFTALEYEVEVDSDADPQVLEEIRTAAETGSPVLDNLLNGTPVEGRLKAGAEA